jgi:phosphatidylserine/phosphatidylglycerophosphate/cardiolipin synthase-like enzyme
MIKKNLNKSKMVSAIAAGLLTISCSTSLNSSQLNATNFINSNSISSSGRGLSPLAQKVYERVLDPKFTNMADSTVPKDLIMTEGNQFIKPFVDGIQIFPGMKEEIALAEHEIDFVTFEWNDKTDASRLIGEGIKLAQENVKEGEKLVVRIVVDQVKEQGNMVVKALNNSRKSWGLDLTKVDLQLAVHPHILLGAIHTKYLVVDGKRVVLTGANVQDVHNFTPNIWHDTGYLVEGPIARTLISDFDEIWAKETVHLDCETRTECVKVETPPTPDRSYFTDFNNTNGFPMLALTKHDRDFISNDINNPLTQAYIAVINNAESYINILTPNINASGFQDAIIAAAKRGVLVKLITGKGFNDASEGLPTQGGTNEEVAKKLHERMTKEAYDMRGKLQIRWYSKTGKYPIDGNGANASHTKYMSVDGKLTIIGSANQDSQTWKQSREFNVLFDDPETTAAIENAFYNNDWQRAIRVPY